ncbi:MAG: lysophospholipid acyltransferase family protein [Candidatus Woykebacteria bacterium]
MKIGANKRQTAAWRNWAIYLLSYLVEYLPSLLSYGVLCPVVAEVTWWLSPSVRRETTANMACVWQGKGVEDPSTWRRSARASQRAATRTWVDMGLIPRIDLERIRSDVQLEGIEYLREAQASGRGVLIAGAHFAGVYRIPHKLVAEGVDLLCPIEPIPSPRLAARAEELQNCGGVKARPLSRQTLVEMRRRLSDGGVVVMLIDRDIQGTGAEMTFLGRPTLMPTGAAKIALKAKGCLVIPGTWERQDAGRYRATLHPPIDPAEYQDNPVSLTMAMLVPIEEQIRKAPESWIPMARVWPEGS